MTPHLVLQRAPQHGTWCLNAYRAILSSLLQILALRVFLVKDLLETIIALLTKLPINTRSGTTTKGLKRNARKMQAYLLLAPICIESSVAVSSIFTENLFLSTRFCSKQWNRRSRTSRSGAVVASAATNNQQDHYAVLGLSSSATLADIKKAYRLLARKNNTWELWTKLRNYGLPLQMIAGNRVTDSFLNFGNLSLPFSAPCTVCSEEWVCSDERVDVRSKKGKEIDSHSFNDKSTLGFGNFCFWFGPFGLGEEKSGDNLKERITRKRRMFNGSMLATNRIFGYQETRNECYRRREAHLRRWSPKMPEAQGARQGARQNKESIKHSSITVLWQSIILEEDDPMTPFDGLIN
ncbi:hypothetical protein Scep_004178 [Stephania cephalantha]|uniref:J domain-containing protein n=1 Tax=Stephania cephalantha TaxID=152367 RepID=A0AAP0KUT2_9MAGN